MSIKILHCADWHLGERKGPVRDGVNLRGQDTIDRIKEIIEFAKIAKPDIVLMSGDVIDKPDVYGKRALKDELDAEELLSELAEYTERMIVIRGTPNHDGAEAFAALNEHFKKNDTVDIVTTPTVIHTPNLDVACLPGFDRGVFRAAYPDVPKEKEAEVFSAELGNIVLGLKGMCNGNVPSVLMAHYYVPGTDTGSGGGSFIQKFEPVLEPTVLNSAAFDLVALGHIHRPQQLPTVKNCFYSGAVNRFTFNDEGFPRGFYMHTIEETGEITSQLIPLKAREFYTIRLDNNDIASINAGLYDMAAYKWKGHAEDAIVRVRYTCMEAEHKALNHALLEKRLYEDGVFYVTEILPDEVLEDVDRKSMGKEADPESNLIEYLRRKEVPEEEIERLVELAKPIIVKAMTDVSASAMQGTFVPISIEVHNYRNYVDEKFDFSPITFCTINGDNGAGKSSLFCDALVDCLYEEPREGGNLGDASWVRGSAEAKSGTIIFTFGIGDKVFRVTRKRLKSGTLTLNLAELIDGEWENRSSERAPETQKKILQILGMDSLTFKSCALIMQDQYGLFLQASKDERMTILSNLLGLGIYDSMARIADEERKKVRVEKDAAQQEIEIQEENIKSYGDPADELEGAKIYLEGEKETLDRLNEQKEVVSFELRTLADAQERAEKLSESIKTLTGKIALYEAERQRQLAVMTECDSVLSQEAEIKAKAEECRALEEQDKQLIEQKTLYVTKKAALAQKEAELAKIKADLVKAEAEKEQEYAKLLILKDDSGDEEIRTKAEEYDQKMVLYDEMKSLQIKHQEMKHELAECEADLKSVVAERWSAMKALEAEQAVLEKKTELLKSSGCVDVENANCKFLQDAKAAEEQLKEIPARREAIEAKYGPVIENFETVIKQHESEVESLGYHQDAMEIIQHELVALKPYKDRAADLQKKALEISALEASLEAKGVNISNLAERFETVKGEGTELASEVEQYKTSYEKSIMVQAQLAQLRPWLEKEKQLPLMTERKTNAIQRYTEMDVQIQEVMSDCETKQKEMDAEIAKTTGIEEKRKAVAELDAKISGTTGNISALQTQIGSLQQKLDTIAEKTKRIEALRESVNILAAKTADYERLKTSFSQDGIPHQIILSILPTLIDTSNTILGQMTGGKMGVDFKTEKVNTQKKEKVTLDVLINEYGKGTLPYLSKSGGEKVKASLAVILALAEIKSSTAGMQLGMLFIDEPPFLDDSGVQAYCDALVTIQRRYTDLKIMAITHDPTMKARFPQGLTVTKDENGSHIRWD